MAYFTEGLMEDMITDLSRFTGLSVLSPHSTRQLSQSSDTILFNELPAEYFVQGSLRLLGSKIRVTIQLIRAADRRVVFAGRHDEDFDAILQVQDDMTRQIVNVLQQQIRQQVVADQHHKPATKLAAYDYYLRGMQELKSGTLEHDLKAREYFNQALAIDPQYARAYTGLSLSFFNEWSCQLWSRWELSKTGAQEYALKAVEMDENEYLALAVLGRTYLFDGQYEKAEHCIRKSLRLNPNDADNLILIASCLTYLGYPEEAESLYRKALWLNPFHPDWYYAYGAFIYFELGEYAQSADLGARIPKDASWVDFPAYQAAAYYMTGDLTRMRALWAVFLEFFQTKVARNTDTDEAAALRWFKEVNPYRGETRLRAFWQYIEEQLSGLAPAPETAPDKPPVGFSFYQQPGELWELCYQGKAVSLTDVKGFRDIQRLLSAPEQEIHCLELMGAAFETDTGEAILDDAAKKDYQKKIRELQADIREAEDMHDLERAARLSQEYEKLVAHLTAALGLGGKLRKTGSAVEKARSAVTWRIRSAIRKIEKHHPALARHLDQSIKTGTLCRYAPEHAVDWVTD